MTLEGEFIRIAYNNEGYVTMGYRVANENRGKDWMLLEVGMTLREGQPTYKLARTAISIDTPDGKKIALATNARIPEQRSARPRNACQHGPGLDQLLSTERLRSGLPYRPLSSPTAVRGPLTTWNSAPIAPASAGSISRCPAASSYGQHFLNVQFQNSLVRVPFKILTKDEEKALSKNWKDIKKQVDEAFKKGK